MEKLSLCRWWWRHELSIRQNRRTRPRWRFQRWRSSPSVWLMEFLKGWRYGWTSFGVNSKKETECWTISVQWYVCHQLCRCLNWLWLLCCPFTFRRNIMAVNVLGAGPQNGIHWKTGFTSKTGEPVKNSPKTARNSMDIHAGLRYFSRLYSILFFLFFCRFFSPSSTRGW